MKQQEGKPPFLKKWSTVYGFIIGTLVVVIVALYFFTQYFK